MKTAIRSTRQKKIAAHVCSDCNKAVTAERRPAGWKERPDGGLLCKECVKDQYVIRSLVLPVAEPVGTTWEEFDRLKLKAWRMSTDLANWTVAEMFRQDKTPVGGAKLEKFSDWYAYGHARDNYPLFSEWDGAKQSLNIVMRSTERKYRDERFAVLARGEHGLLRYRYPAPYPVDADAWKAWFGSEHEPLVSFGMPGQQVTLRLKRKADLARQIAMFGEVVAGKVIRGEAALYRVQRKGQSQLMFKMVGLFRRQPITRERVNTCLLVTSPESLLIAEIIGGTIPPQRLLEMQPEARLAFAEEARVTRTWTLNHDHLRRWAAERDAYLQRTSEDLKREKRATARQRHNLLKARETRLKKYDDRIKTALEQASAQVAKFCERQRVSVLAYDDSIRSFVNRLPWHIFKEMLTRKLSDRGVLLVSA